MNVGWKAHHHGPKNCGLHWPYVPLHYPLPTHVLFVEIDIWCCALDTKQKFPDRFCKSGYRVFKLPELQLLPMPQRMMAEEEQDFCTGRISSLGRWWSKESHPWMSGWRMLANG